MNRMRRSVAARAILCALLASCCFAAASRADVSLDLSPGFDKFCREGEWTPLVVRLKGAAREGAAIVRLSVSNVSGTRVYTCPVQLHDGAINEQRTLYYVSPATGSDVRVQLVQDGRVISDKKLDNSQTIGEDQTSVVALTQDHGGLSYLGQIRIPVPGRPQQNQQMQQYTGMPGRNPTTVLYPSAGDLPDGSHGYDGADVVVLADVSPDQLSDDQWSALGNWVKDGGTLVISGGGDLNRLRAKALADLLPVQPSGVKLVSALPSLAYQYGTAPRLKPTPIAVGTLTEGSVAVARDGVTPLVARRAVGAGAVYFTAFDLKDPGIAAWPGQQQLWGGIIGRGADARVIGIMAAAVNPRGNAYNGYNQYYRYGGGSDMRVLADALAGVRSAAEAPSFTLIGGFLVAYIIFLVPLNYLILRRFDRRELAWITAPVIILAFSSGAYAIGYAMKGSALTLHYASVVEGAANTRGFEAYTVGCIFSPRQTRYTLSVDDPAAVADEVVSEPGFQSGAADLVVDRDQRTAVKDAIVNMWDHRTFAFDSHVDLGGAVAASIEPTPSGGYQARITNGTARAFRGCALSQGGTSAFIGNLEPGQTVTSDLPGGTRGGGIHIPASGGYSPATGSSRIEQAMVQIIDGGNRMDTMASPPPATDAPLLLTGWFSDPASGIQIDNEHPTSDGASLLVLHLPTPGAALR